MSKRDRESICNVITDMLDNPDDVGIFSTSTAYTRLEFYIEEVRMEAVGWAIADACIILDKGEDPRTTEVPEILARAQSDLD